jgi:hypothetical protein
MHGETGNPGLTELPHQNTLRTKTRLNACINNCKMRDIYAKSIRIDKAVATIQRGEFIYYANTAKYYRYDRSTLSRRIRGLTKTKKQANLF